MKIKSQPRIPGLQRIPTGSSLLPNLRDEVDFCAKMFKCSKSFVVATALADHFGIELEFRYNDSLDEPHKRDTKNGNGHKKLINIKKKRAA